MGVNQIELVQIEQRIGVNQRPLYPFSRLLPNVPSFPDIINLLAVLSGPRACFSRRILLLCSRYTLLSVTRIVAQTL